MEILKIKNTVTNRKNSMDGINNRLDMAEERINSLENWSIENGQV